MSDEQYYWCRKHGRVETTSGTCPAQDLLGPYPSAEAARDWKEQHDAREEHWEAQDEAWEGE